MAKIVIPANVEDLIKLGQKIFQKHEADGEDSPLRLQKDYNWSQNGPNLDKALQLHEEAEALRREMERKYKERDLLMGNIGEAVKGSRDILKGTYRSQLRKLGDWGFEVNDAPRSGGNSDTPQ